MLLPRTLPAFDLDVLHALGMAMLMVVATGGVLWRLPSLPVVVQAASPAQLRWWLPNSIRPPSSPMAALPATASAQARNHSLTHEIGRQYNLARRALWQVDQPLSQCP